jgi:hypothetical protein
MSNSPNGVITAILSPRRSNRKAATIPIWLRSEGLGPIWEEETETQIVSRCGAGLCCRHLVSPESIVVIVRRDTGRRAKARVRYSRYNPDGKRELGVEFIDNDNFWGFDWNSLEPSDSQPELAGTPSDFPQMSESMVAAEIGEAGVRQSKFDLSHQLNSEQQKNKRRDRRLIQEVEFVFTEDGKPVGTPARTPREFVTSLLNSAPSAVEGHILRGDFSRWIAAVFHDQLLVSEIQELEERYRHGRSQDLCASLARLIAEYCDFSEEP